MQLKVLDAPRDLIASKKVIINTDNDTAEINEGDVVKLTKGFKITAAIVHKIEYDNKDSIRMDKYLRGNLGVEIGDTVKIEKVDCLADAESVEVLIPEDAGLNIDRVEDLLVGLIVCEGNHERFIEEGITVKIGKTFPKELIKVTESTELKADFVKGIKIKTILHLDDHGHITAMASSPTVCFDDIGGLEDVKQILRENIVYAIEKADIYKEMGYEAARGIMLYGPPGTGKTMIAKATANEAKAMFIYCPSSELKREYYGQSERKMRDIFSEAKENAPCIIFFDEIDAIAGARSDWKVNIVNQLLSLMDEISESNIFVIGTTNLLAQIDRALLRPGRFISVEVPPPSKEAREEIFRVHLKNTQVGDINFKELVSATEGSTGAQIRKICYDAKMIAMRETGYSSVQKLEMKHLREAAKNPDRHWGPEVV